MRNMILCTVGSPTNANIHMWNLSSTNVPDVQLVRAEIIQHIHTFPVSAVGHAPAVVSMPSAKVGIHDLHAHEQHMSPRQVSRPLVPVVNWEREMKQPQKLGRPHLPSQGLLVVLIELID